MGYQKIEILGLRGFSDNQSLEFAIPSNNLIGSGLTVIVGPNNSGKSTIFEALRALSQNEPPSFTDGRRNKIAGDKVKLRITKIDGTSLILQTIDAGGSESEFVQEGISQVRCFTLPSRRSFNPFFSKGHINRDAYINSTQLSATRGIQLSSFYNRLFRIQSNQDEFNSVLVRVLGEVPNWKIDQTDEGKYFLKFNYNGSFHNSDGMGEGILSVFTIVDTLYDSSEGDLIFIDEPELSLHPSLQKKLAILFAEFSADRQIVISTHSPYFINWNSIFNGGAIARTIREVNGTKIFQLARETASKLQPLIKNLNNPHILGINAKEIFFLDDKIIIVEGQEDVIFLKRAMRFIERDLHGNFYGWGIGGATNTDKILQMLSDLGYKRVTVILDNNMAHIIPSLQEGFPSYLFVSIPTDDVRDKNAVQARPAVQGLINSGGTEIYPEYVEQLGILADEINTYFDV